MKGDPLRDSRAPLYLQISGILREKIARGIWKPGEFLPTVAALAEEYQVARITVRQAVKLLQEEGLVAPRRGHGTTVLTPPEKARPLNVVTRLADLVDSYRDDKPELVPLEDGERSLPGDLHFGTPFDEGYHMIRRMHARDGQIYCIISIYLALPIFLKHETRLRAELALPVLFDEPDIDIAKARQTLQIGRAGIEIANLLDLKIGDPVADVRRILCDGSGSIIYMADVIYRGDYVHLDMDLLA
ncbi:GntR family transcriptional regulator [Paracoccus sp. Z330]|uniref:GntR family transcriptional regulator n=1 Tax=Paracoccus onchidii TaxID=3017813 RepID=A0ABT4ZEF4_9RHOB|nr:GntR family transcriptional regulator [Paracoccus onchidii]MDB6177726.1 GntR family transcriptional regulator [Paracoccus onchidii]